MLHVAARLGDTEPLLEREEALATLCELFDAACAGDGRTAVIRGPAGIGKTRLFSAFADHARARGARLLTARGGELERDYSFGVARALLEPPVRAAGPAERAELLAGAASPAADLVLASAPERRDLHSRLHGLYWLALNLAARTPLVLAVDDAHWCDPESLRWLAYLARRAAGAPIMLVGAWRAGEPEPPGDLLSAEGARGIQLPPLGADSVGTILSGRLGAEAGRAVVDAAHRATGGNPFLVSELARALASGEIAAEEVLERPPVGVERDVHARLARMPPGPRELAFALAVLGQEATLREAAELAGLDAEVAAQAATALVEAGMLATSVPPCFAHPLVRQAIEAGSPASERSLAHRRAARLLWTAGNGGDRVAPHLLAAEPEAEEWAVDALIDAGATAMGRGAMESALRLMRRALAESPMERRRVRVLHLLGQVEATVRDPSAREHLEEARALADDPRLRVEIGRDLAHDLYLGGRVREAVEQLEAAVLLLGPEDRDLAMAVEAQAAGLSLADRATVADGRRRLAGLAGKVSDATAGERMVLAQLAFTEAMAGTSLDRAVRWARQALEGGLLLDVAPEAQLFQLAVSVLDAADLLSEAAQWRTAGIDRARATGSETGYAFCSCFRARTNIARGALREAEADARAALSAADPASRRVLGTATAFLLEALVEQGRASEAVGVLEESPVPIDAIETFPLCHVRLARGRVRLERGEPAAAAADALAAGAIYEEWGVRNPALAPWRSLAALALHASGDIERARSLAREELDRARQFGAARAQAVAERAVALTERPGGADRLAAAAAMLADSEARLDRARVLVDLGACERRGGHRTDAIGPLREGLDLAHRCHATALAARARDELAAAGARPRRPDLHGTAALTAQELRIARMAADGLTNREIAQALFVTLSTVEAHLTRAFRKLEIASRRQLTAALRDA